MGVAVGAEVGVSVGVLEGVAVWVGVSVTVGVSVWVGRGVCVGVSVKGGVDVGMPRSSTIEFTPKRTKPLISKTPAIPDSNIQKRLGASAGFSPGKTLPPM